MYKRSASCCICSHFSRKPFVSSSLPDVNFLQDALRAFDDEELERFIRWLNMERELRTVSLWKQAERSHEQGSSARQCLHACRYCSRPCIFQSFSASHCEMHDRTDWHRCHLHSQLPHLGYCVCVCHPLIAKRNLSPFHVSPSFLFPFNRRGAASISGLRCLAKTVQFCCDIGRGRLIYVPACTDATKKLQGLGLSSAKKQIGTCDDFRRSYSLQGAMKVCVCVCLSLSLSLCALFLPPSSTEAS